MTDKLKYIYDDIYRWLVFAEAKNIAMMTLILACFDKIIEIDIQANANLTSFKYVTISFLIAALIILAISFIPFLNKRSLLIKFSKWFYRYYDSSDNVIFYITVFLHTLKKDYGSLITQIDKEKELNSFDSDLLDQITNIATVAAIKYMLFTVVCVILLLALMVCGYIYYRNM